MLYEYSETESLLCSFLDVVEQPIQANANSTTTIYFDLLISMQFPYAPNVELSGDWNRRNNAKQRRLKASSEAQRAERAWATC